MLPIDKKDELRAELDSLKATTDILGEIKQSVVEAPSLNKEQVSRHMQLRLEPEVLVNDEVISKKHIYRIVIKIL